MRSYINFCYIWCHFCFTQIHLVAFWGDRGNHLCILALIFVTSLPQSMGKQEDNTFYFKWNVKSYFTACTVREPLKWQELLMELRWKYSFVLGNLKSGKRLHFKIHSILYDSNIQSTSQIFLRIGYITTHNLFIRLNLEEFIFLLEGRKAMFTHHKGYTGIVRFKWRREGNWVGLPLLFLL